jgi:hypothetical protein
VFEPNGLGGFVVSTPGSGSGRLSGGGGGGGGGCVMQPGDRTDPLFPVMLSGLAVVYALRRRRKSARQQAHG